MTINQKYWLLSPWAMLTMDDVFPMYLHWSKGVIDSLLPYPNLLHRCHPQLLQVVANSLLLRLSPKMLPCLPEANQICQGYQCLILDERGKLCGAIHLLAFLLSFSFLWVLLIDLWLFSNQPIYWVMPSSLIGKRLPHWGIFGQKGLYITVKPSFRWHYHCSEWLWRFHDSGDSSERYGWIVRLCSISCCL